MKAFQLAFAIELFVSDCEFRSMPPKLASAPRFPSILICESTGLKSASDWYILGIKKAKISVEKKNKACDASNKQPRLPNYLKSINKSISLLSSNSFLVCVFI